MLDAVLILRTHWYFWSQTSVKSSYKCKFFFFVVVVIQLKCLFLKGPFTTDVILEHHPKDNHKQDSCPGSKPIPVNSFLLKYNSHIQCIIKCKLVEAIYPNLYFVKTTCLDQQQWDTLIYFRRKKLPAKPGSGLGLSASTG